MIESHHNYLQIQALFFCWKNVRINPSFSSFQKKVLLTVKSLFSYFYYLLLYVQFWRVFVCNLSAGGLAGGTAMLAAYPLDVVRTK